ncbi:hypothetical protein [Roseiarcus sp.]|uniref:hypothetical protein n=1 Tax=Roseiarcus sp. TaxID=1969460 RepID=UPI003F9A11CA
MAQLFAHPLATSAKVFSARTEDGVEQHVLVIMTNLALDASSDRYRADLVEGLTAAARSYINKSDYVTGFALVNRPEDWLRSDVGHRRENGGV